MKYRHHHARAEAPKVAVVASLWPHAGRPFSGLFVRERMGRVGRQLPVTVIVPVPWFPGQSLLRRWWPHYRPPAPRWEQQGGVTVYFPRFLALPGLGRRWDGFWMGRAVARAARRHGPFDVLDAHFGYPDGDAACRAGARLGVPVTVTFRGTEARLVHTPWARRRLEAVARYAYRVFAVAESLRQLALDLGADPARTRTLPNGVDTDRFHPRDRVAARQALAIAPDAPVLVTVGGLTERKGQHRVIDCLPALIRQFPELVYLVIGGGSGEGDAEAGLRALAAARGVADHVRFLGPLDPAELAGPLSAADVFVLATGNEGWANVLLEAMACGLPVVTTDVGGNREVISHPALGELVVLGDGDGLTRAIADALVRDWDQVAIRRHAEAHQWEHTVEALIGIFDQLHQQRGDNYG